MLFLENDSSILPIALSMIALSINFWPFGKRRNNGGESVSEQVLSANQGSDAPEMPDEARNVDFVDWGVRLAMQGKVERALDKFRKASQDNPTDPLAHYNLGLALDLIGKHAEAVDSYEQAKQLAPAVAEVSNNYGVGLYAVSDYVHASEEFSSAQSAAADNPMFAFNLGSALLQSGDYAESANQLAKAAEMLPDDPQVRFNYAVALMHLGDKPKARAEFLEFLELSPEGYPERRAIAEAALIRCMDESADTSEEKAAECDEEPLDFNILDDE